MNVSSEYNDALRLALCAGQYLDISTKSEYVDTIIAKCIDEYKGQRELQETDPTVHYALYHVIHSFVCFLLPTVVFLVLYCRS